MFPSAPPDKLSSPLWVTDRKLVYCKKKKWMGRKLSLVVDRMNSLRNNAISSGRNTFRNVSPHGVWQKQAIFVPVAMSFSKSFWLFRAQAPHKPMSHHLVPSPQSDTAKGKQDGIRAVPVCSSPGLDRLRPRPGLQCHRVMTFPGLIIRFSWQYCVDAILWFSLEWTSEIW